MLALLGTFSLRELRHHPWRNAAAVLSVMLGVALAFSVQLINASALDEFSSAVRSTGGQPDVELRAVQGGFDEALYARVAASDSVALASPVLELQTTALVPGGERRPLRVLGIDALVAGAVAPGLVPALHEQDRFALFAPGNVFLNPAAQQQLGDRFSVQSGLQVHEVRAAGTVSAAGAPLAVMDIAAAQDLFGRDGELTRIDVRLKPGADRDRFVRSLDLPDSVTAANPGDATQRVDSLSRAYRVNLTVLALVALFTGAFLVFSVLALSVARRAQQFALLAVLGLTPRERLALVLVESAWLGAIGSVAGIALGALLAELALTLLGGDLGGGYFPGVAPRLQWSTPAAIVYAVLGIVAAMAGGWLPARNAQRLPPARTLKGLGYGLPGSRAHLMSLAFIVAGALCALLPPVAGIPLAAYVSVGLLLVGGITGLPWVVALLYDRLAKFASQRALVQLAVERARRVRESAAVAVSGVVAALSLAVALTVMVASFRDSVAHWLDVVLPADLYVRTAGSSAAADTAFLPAAFADGVSRIEGVARVRAQRLRPLQLDPARPAVTLLARAIGDPSINLPLVQGPVAPPAAAVPVYVSEAMVDLYGARMGQPLPALARAFGGHGTFFVAGVWRDYVRQSGAVLMEESDYRRLTGDTRATELQVWLRPGAAAAEVSRGIRALAAASSQGADLIDVASAAELRATSLRIFDRSFAVTYWLQAVAIAIGLFGVAASFSAQVLARRKEFGLLAHLGLTRREILAVVAGEGAAWTLIGAVAGIALGLAVSVVLVDVVNPQSFHWTMDLRVPWLRLLALACAVIAAGTLTARFAGRAAASRDAVLAVKEDW
ncbi:MAG TPA: FtsX-like permease family protein [Ramlibacter sp.]|uniref:FtsX-like permease family protein n=1 Tax=Ramlibacter sp. TaxID=1917967 RepID=UPI002CAACE7E|nr:FtsX-like permease family protein [Ramlibacter sp.]HVZ42907.1 FtsX-like permease family protein [Ramlibacter sp.]